MLAHPPSLPPSCQVKAAGYVMGQMQMGATPSTAPSSVTMTTTWSLRRWWAGTEASGDMVDAVVAYYELTLKYITRV